MGLIGRWDDWKCPRCDSVNGPKIGRWCDVCAEEYGDMAEVVELVPATDVQGAVEALREMYEATKPYQPKVEGVNAEDDRLSAARWVAGQHIGGR